MMTAAIVLAAGASSRMRGRDKLMEDVDGAPVLARTIRLAQASCAPVLVCLPPDRPDRDAVVTGLGAAPVRVDGARDGMGTSLAHGIRALPENIEEVMVFVSDLPDLTTEDVRSVLSVAAEFPDMLIFRACDEAGRPGHPVLFRRALFGELAKLSGDTGARDVIRANVRLLKQVALPDGHATTDLDTPEDWAAWRARRR